MHYVYLLQYGNEEGYYTGCTGDLKKRIKEHRNGQGCQTTKGVEDPTRWKIVYAEIYRTQEAVYTREKKLKQYGSALQRLKQRM
jgi:putative endonuclease